MYDKLKDIIPNDYKIICECTLQAFCHKLGIEYDPLNYDEDVRWVGSYDVPHIAYINDMYWGVNDMVMSFELNIPGDKCIEWYWEDIERRGNSKPSIKLEKYVELQYTFPPIE